MAKKKKKKPTGDSRRVRELEHMLGRNESRVIDLETFSRQANSKIMDLENNVDALQQTIRSIREAAQREAEMRVTAESMVYRKLIHTLMADRQGVDLFLDRLSDLAPEIAKGVLVGTFEDTQLVDGVRPNRADDNRSAPPLPTYCGCEENGEPVLGARCGIHGSRYR